MIELALLLMMASSKMDTPKEISFPTQDGGIVYADLYGSGERGVVLAHGARFDKLSWSKQADQLAAAGFRVVAIDFRGYGKSGGGSHPKDEKYLDVLAAAGYLRETGAKSIAIIGGSMGGGAAAEAAVKADPGIIDRLVLLAPVPIEHPERIKGAKLFIASHDDPIAPRMREQYAKAPEPKQLIIVDGSAHAQFLFQTEQSERVMRDILQFLSAPPTEPH
jgi:pimeloyl-ACP methyl ester carboxylesterase